MADFYPQEDNPTVTILLLGDSGCGKSTFLSSLKSNHRRLQGQGRGGGGGGGGGGDNVPLRDSDQPFLYDIRFSKKSFTLEVYDTASPNQHWSTLRPDVVLLAFDVSDRETLNGLKGWRHDIIRYFQRGDGERIPIMVVGLKRDLRVESEGVIYPQESYRIAQELRCDRYAECSAVTGELLAETFEDIARMAGMTLTAAGGQSKGGCVVC
ncbi:putative Rho-like small GTPase [Aspergillus saccharolyticus JOP 1030-1]|uniref:Rho-like small GTPase n=1 Tax=Aspergillus saccharolyticus JOP 1030-1 TaxID=1450539 RepID=A0A318YZ20_9EURO|nr:Rho-like small GTPase [Aspergillus saccharolyticus JOP 1030-1]PYH40251.1 Rho-like small GTPase [Aspergillus saccharolyticus JOP 1030-1]